MYKFLPFCLFLLLIACNAPEKNPATQQGVTATKDAPTSIETAYNLKPTGKTSFGYEYIKHTDAPGDNVEPGTYAFFDYQVKIRDTVVASNVGQNLEVLRIDSSEQVVAGKQPSPVSDALRLMSVGDSMSVYWSTKDVPRMPVGFEDEPYVQYDLVLKEVKNEAEYQVYLEAQRKEMQQKKEAAQKRGETIGKETTALAAKYRAGKLDGQLQKTASGLQYIIHEEGTGVMPQKNNTVLVHYYGMLTDGTRFDDSFSRGQPFNFPLGVGRVIPGWDEGIALLKEGTKATLFIPYELGYGEAGSPPNIPERAELIFYVELEKVYQ